MLKNLAVGLSLAGLVACSPKVPDRYEPQDSIETRIETLSESDYESAQRFLSDEFIARNDPFLTELARNSGKETESVFENLPPALVEIRQDEIIKLSNKYGPAFGGLLALFGEDVIESENRYSDKLLEVQNYAGDLAGDIFANMQKEDPGTDLDAIISLTHRYGPAAWGLLYNFQDDFQGIEREHGALLEELYLASGGCKDVFAYLRPELLDDHGDELLHIAFAAKENTGRAFASLPYSLFTSNPAQIVDIAKAAGTASDEAFRLLSHQDNPDLDYFRRLIEGNRRFGIQHFDRYRTTPLLEDNLKAIPSNRPLAVAVITKDESVAFDGSLRLYEQIYQLKAGYDILVYEADSDIAALDALRYAYELTGRTVSLGIFAGHGTETSLLLGTDTADDPTQEDITRNESAYLDINDQEKLERYAKFMDADANLVLVSCMTGKGRGQRDNLANMFKRSLPGRTIFAPTEPTTLDEFVLDENHNLVDVRFSLVKDIRYVP